MNHFSPAALRAYKKERIRKSLTVGSQWVFFKDGDDPAHTGDFKDSWAGFDIRITHIRFRDGKFQRFAKRIRGRGKRATTINPSRRVNYSELW